MILNQKEKLGPEAEDLIALIRKRSLNLYQTRQLLCTEAVLMALNNSLDGGLSESQVIAMAAPFCMALGESGCLCGALSGAVMGCGLILGNHRPYNHRRELRDSARQLHDTFKQENGGICCRVLSNHVRHDKQIHFRRCAELTAEATELAARLILKKRPELVGLDDNGFLKKNQSMVGGVFSRLFHNLFHIGLSS